MEKVVNDPNGTDLEFYASLNGMNEKEALWHTIDTVNDVAQKEIRICKTIAGESWPIVSKKTEENMKEKGARKVLKILAKYLPIGIPVATAANEIVKTYKEEGGTSDRFWETTLSEGIALGVGALLPVAAAVATTIFALGTAPAVGVLLAAYAAEAYVNACGADKVAKMVLDGSWENNVKGHANLEQAGVQLLADYANRYGEEAYNMLAMGW